MPCLSVQSEDNGMSERVDVIMRRRSQTARPRRRTGGGSDRSTRRTVLAGMLALGGGGPLTACASRGDQAPAGAQSPVTLESWLWFGPESLAGAQPMLSAYKVVAPQVTLGWSGIGGADFLT